MTNKEIIEGNRLIVLSPFSEEDVRIWANDIGNLSDNFLLNLYYHISWSSLMPVITKISKDERVDCVSLVISSGCDVHFKEVFNGADCWVPMGSNDSPIGAAYKMCIKFIKWYNKQKT